MNQICMITAIDDSEVNTELLSEVNTELLSEVNTELDVGSERLELVHKPLDVVR